MASLCDHVLGQFCTTERGYAGFVPYDALPGDSIVLIDGAAVPFVVRADGEGETADQAVLVGECYIHGIMHSEALGFDGFARGHIYLA